MSRHLFVYAGILLLFIHCRTAAESPEAVPVVFSPELEVFPVNSSIRAIAAVSAEEVWYAGNRGQYGYTLDGGKSWVRDSMYWEGKPLEFRALVVKESAVFLLCTKSPALLFRSQDRGASWELVYQESGKGVYYNAMAFWDEREGIAVGDPVKSGCLSVIITRDGGKHWEKLPCTTLPPLVEGEAGFAASNTNIATYQNHAWVATGGQKARVFHSPDRGQNWQSFDTPMAQGGDMTGIFSVSFLNEKEGIMVGGDWEDKARIKGSRAWTQNGGQSWNTLADTVGPAFRSCIQYVPGTQGKELFAVGIPGLSYSEDGGQSWQTFSEESFYTIRMAGEDRSAWMAGRNKVARLVW
ncbi:MAG: oxidoreductase [Bacteroidota bacterium]